MNRLKQLKTKKGRDETGQFIVEGEKAVSEIPESWEVCYYAVAERYAGTNDISALKNRAECVIMRDALFDGAADTMTPQGVIAVCRQKRFTLNEVVQDGGFLLMGERLSDPGNIGALIRTAAAAACGGVVLTEGSGEIYNPKVVRASAAAVLKIPVVTGVSISLAADTMKRAGISVCAASVNGGVTPYELDLTGGICFLIGNEARGLSDAALNTADKLVRLPMPGGTESLNAAVAGSILLYEAVRQRMKK